MFDGKPDSRIAFDVADPKVRVDFHGLSVEADRIEILGSASFPAGKDGGASLTLLGSADGSARRRRYRHACHPGGKSD